ncbi:hypothetical protein [Nocardia jejuensis]|uniref:hypothetical protein n=1 Tax=Nocardia jejuensis TaxID=328049 RepID=UPI00082D305F|nr:hypothetical protein [Nocardia jejuensis]
MRLEVTSDAVEYQKLTAEFLGRDPLRHTVLLTILDNMVSGVSVYPGRFVSVHEGACVIGAASWTESHGVMLSELPDSAVEAVADVFAETGVPVPDVEGVEDHVLAFAERWTSGRESRFELDYRTRLFRLGEPVIPSVPGHARRAVEANEPVRDFARYTLDSRFRQ